MKVTLTIETDDQYTSVMRSGETPAIDRLLAECIIRVADTFNSHKLEDMARAVKAAYEKANRR